MNTNIRRLAIAFVVIFGLMSIDLVYWQVIDAGALNSHAGLPANPRIRTEAEHVIRGRIYDRNGQLLVGRRIYRDGFVQPVYKDPSLAQTIGYHTFFRFGSTGLEAAYNAYLSGKRGTSWRQTYDSWLHRPVQGDDLFLTVDERLQQVMANALPGSPSAAVALDPRTGEVLAAVSKPYFDATCLGGQSGVGGCARQISAIPNAPFVNRVTGGQYPPGSTFKTVTLSAAIDSGIQSLSSYYPGIKATGPLTVDGFTFPSSINNLVCGRTSVDLLHAFMYSDNIVFAQVGLKLGKRRFLDYAQRFGFGKPIPFDLPTSVGGVRMAGERFDRVALASSAFGQGKDHVSPLQMALVASTIADRGRMPRPILVKSIKTPGGAVVGGDNPASLGNPINSGTASQVRHAMVEVVSGQCGSGFEAQIPGVAVAGKTGTAESGTGAPDAWFIAFAPARHPTVAVAVIVENGGEGAFVAAPIAKQIIQAALQYGE